MGAVANAAVLLALLYSSRTPGPAPVVAPEAAALSVAQIEQAIWEAGMARRMLLAGGMLAESPGGVK